MKELKINITGMMCEGCENRVKNTLKELEDVNEVSANHNTGEVVVKLNKEIDKKVIEDTLEDLGYEVVKEK